MILPCGMLLLVSSVGVLGSEANVPELSLGRDFRLGRFQPLRLTGLEGWRLIPREYPSENAIEWQARLQAPAEMEPPLYTELQSADFVVRFDSDSPVTLHWSKGSRAEASDFQPRDDVLTVGKPVVLQSFGGRSSDGVLPYFNLASDGGGLIVAVGWSGDWKATFNLLGEGKVRVTAGLARSRFKLRAGERVRLPSILLLAYRGRWIDGQNRFRRLMLRHFTPTSYPPMELMPVAASVHGMFGFNETSESELVKLAGDIAALKLPLDTFWLDAGWNEGGFPAAQGNPNADPKRFPRGLAPVGAAARQAGMRFLVWFEPERAMRGSWLDRERRTWLLEPAGTPPELRYLENDGFRLLDLGRAEARNWALDSIGAHIRDAGIAIYRQDFNVYPSFFWRTGEADDAVGLREIRYTNGLYEFLDELARRHPGLIMDNCASGGRRLDFELMRRCVALWRSDNCWDDQSAPRNLQAMTHGLSHWLPLHGLGASSTDAVMLRSGMGACASYAINFRDLAAVARLRQHLDRYLKVRALFAADFYPLTEWSTDPAKWLAFQFHDEGTGQGLVQAFCGTGAPQQGPRLMLRGLEPDRFYTITDWDNPSAPIKRRGAELARTGIEVRSQGGNTAIVLEYHMER